MIFGTGHRTLDRCGEETIPHHLTLDAGDDDGHGLLDETRRVVDSSPKS